LREVPSRGGTRSGRNRRGLSVMAGLPWFKLAGDFFQHPKTLELQAELGDPCADVYIVRMWAYVSRVAASGRLAGRNVVTVLERAVGWHGEPGRFVRAALAVGFLEQEADALVIHDWAREQGAHVAKVEKDRARPPAHRRVSDTAPVPARDPRGNVAGSRQGPEVEREIETEMEITASQATASAAPPPGDDLPDATDAQPVTEERPPLVLHVQPAEKKPRAPAPGVALYARLEDRRQKACTEDVVPYVPSRWAFSRQNRELGPIAKAETSNPEEWERFRGAWQEFVDDPESRNLDVPYSLDWFMRCRSRYEGRALKAAGGGA
jgi:hypothetical protein